MLVDLEHMDRMIKWLKVINHTPLDQIDWVKGGEVIVVSPEMVKEWKFTGLSNAQFAQIHLLNK